MPATIVQVNVSNGGVPKRAIAQGRVTAEGVVGDRHAHPHIHGGPTKAVLLITSEGIEELKCEGYDVYPGALGENFTTQGLDRKQVRIGQRYRVGSAVIEITKMRQPCDQLSGYGTGIQRAVYDERVRDGDATSPLWGLAGFYAAVVKPGVVEPGDAVIALEEAC
jgi:MOSC domain-containing protein YiiM